MKRLTILRAVSEHTVKNSNRSYKYWSQIIANQMKRRILWNLVRKRFISIRIKIYPFFLLTFPPLFLTRAPSVEYVSCIHLQIVKKTIQRDVLYPRKMKTLMVNGNAPYRQNVEKNVKILRELTILSPH